MVNNKKKYEDKDFYYEYNEKKYETLTEELIEDVRLHFHDYLEGELVLDGEAEQSINDYRIHIKRGSFSLLRPNIDCHSLEIKHMKVFKFYVKPFFIDDGLWKEISLLPNPLVVDLEEEILKHVINVFNALEYCQSHVGLYTDEMAKNMINALLYLFVQIKGGHINNSEKRKSIIDYLLKDDRYLTDVTLEDFAHDFGYSLSHASKYFKENSGMNFSEAKQFFRIQHAKRLLLSTDYSINEISIMCGFNYYPLFHNSFKKNTGMTPFEFRKNNK